MTQSTNRIGRIGEDLAVRYLEKQGLQILDRNWRSTIPDLRGELDVVVQDGSTLVFVEVKCRRSSSSADTLAGVTWQKQRQLRRLATLYLTARAEHVAVRFDVVAVSWPPEGGAADILHLRSAF